MLSVTSPLVDGCVSNILLQTARHQQALFQLIEAIKLIPVFLKPETTTTTVSWPFCQNYLGESVPEEIFTNSHVSWSSVIFYLLPPSIAIHGILPVQFTCLTVFCTISVQVLFGLPLGLAPSTSYSIHFFIQSLSSFCSTCPCHRNLFCCSTRIIYSLILVSLSLSLSILYLELHLVA